MLLNKRKEETIMKAKKIVLFCGLGTSGKDFWAEKVLGWYKSEYPNLRVVFIGISQARKQYWGKSEDMTDADHLLKNEITLLEIKKQFIVHGADVVVANMTMLTQNAHQLLPFIRMVSETELLMSRKSREQRARQSGQTLEMIEFERVNIDLCVFWMVCKESISLVRLAKRMKEINQGGGLITVSEFRKGQQGFEPPGNYYPYLKIDTSDESSGADVRREKIIRSQIFNLQQEEVRSGK